MCGSIPTYDRMCADTISQLCPTLCMNKRKHRVCAAVRKSGTPQLWIGPSTQRLCGQRAVWFMSVELVGAWLMGIRQGAVSAVTVELVGVYCEAVRCEIGICENKHGNSPPH